MAEANGGHMPMNPDLDRAMALLHELDDLKATSAEPRIATLTDRALARCIDFLFYVIIALVVVPACTEVVYLASNPSKGNPVLSPSFTSWVALGFTLALFVAAMAYETVPALLRARLPGKHFLHLTVVDSAGHPAGARRLAFRALLWLLPCALCFCGWGLTFPSMASMPFFLIVLVIIGGTFASVWRSDAGRGWHDRIAGTHVIGQR